MNNTKERIIEFIDSKGISKRKFCIEIEVAHVYFSTKGAMTSDVLERIIRKYPEINMDWIIGGRGKMLMKDQFEHFFPTPQAQMVVGENIEPAKIAIDALKQQNVDLKDELYELKTELIKCMRENKELIKAYQNQPVEKNPAD